MKINHPMDNGHFLEKLQKRNNKTIDKSFANDKQDAKEFNKMHMLKCKKEERKY